MQVIYEKIEKRPNYEIFIDFRCICNGLDIETFGTVRMSNVDYDKHLTTSAARIDSEDDAEMVLFSSLTDEVYDYIDEQVEAIKDNVFDDLF